MNKYQRDELQVRDPYVYLSYDYEVLPVSKVGKEAFKKYKASEKITGKFDFHYLDHEETEAQRLEKVRKKALDHAAGVILSIGGSSKKPVLSQEGIQEGKDFKISISKPDFKEVLTWEAIPEL